MNLADIYREFQDIESIPEKIQYLRDASWQGLPFDINWSGPLFPVDINSH